MSQVKVLCETCGVTLRVSPEAANEGYLRCPRCRTVFSLETSADSALSQERGKRRRQSRQPPAQSVPWGLILGGTVLGGMLLGVVGALGVFFLLRTADSARPMPSPQANAPRDPGPGRTPQNPPAAPQQQAGMIFQLSNGKVTRALTGLNFTVDCKIIGVHRPNETYYWVIKSSRGKTYEVRIWLLDIQRDGTLTARTIGDLGDGLSGSFQCHIESGPFVATGGFNNERQIVSNVLSMQIVQSAPDSPFEREPTGPPRIPGPPGFPGSPPGFPGSPPGFPGPPGFPDPGFGPRRP